MRRRRSLAPHEPAVRLYGGLGRLVCAWILCASATCQAQQDTFESLTQRAAKAYQSKDYAAFLMLEKQALALSALDPRTAYNVACGEALARHPAEAVRLLDQLINRGLDFDADRDPDFAAIHQAPEWAAMTARLADLRKPIVRSSIAFTLPEKGLMATSIAVDPQNGNAFIASSRERKVVRRTKDGVVSDFVTEKDGLLAASYVLIDAARRQLIVSSAGVPFMHDFRPEDESKTGICIFDLGTGKLVRQAFLAGATGHHLLNAMVVDRGGNVFVVDSGSAEIYRLRRASSELELYVSSVVFRAPQGLALSEDERTLYVVDYIEGLYAMEVLSTDRRHIDSSPDMFMNGMLGLARIQGGFVGVQNGVRPNRVVRIRLDAKGERVSSLETLERNHPEYAGPTQGVVYGNDFLYVANSQINLLDPKTGTFPLGRAQATTILRLDISK